MFRYSLILCIAFFLRFGGTLASSDHKTDHEDRQKRLPASGKYIIIMPVYEKFIVLENSYTFGPDDYEDLQQKLPTQVQSQTQKDDDQVTLEKPKRKMRLKSGVDITFEVKYTKTILEATLGKHQPIRNITEDFKDFELFVYGQTRIPVKMRRIFKENILPDKDASQNKEGTPRKQFLTLKDRELFKHALWKKELTLINQGYHTVFDIQYHHEYQPHVWAVIMNMEQKSPDIIPDHIIIRQHIKPLLEDKITHYSVFMQKLNADELDYFDEELLITFSIAPRFKAFYTFEDN